MGTHCSTFLRSQRLKFLGIMKRGRRNWQSESPTDCRGHETARVNAAVGRHSFAGDLVDGKQAYDWLIETLPNAGRRVSLCSAFIRSEALTALIPKGAVFEDGRILVRWQLGDLQSGASDLKAYNVAKEMGFRFFVRQDFHGKVFSLPGIGLVVGSANATLAGMGLRDGANAEICTLVPSSEANLASIDDLFSGAVEVDDSLFLELDRELQLAPLDPKEYGRQWPNDLMNRLQCTVAVKYLLMSECLISIPVMDNDGHFQVVDKRDRQLLGLTDLITDQASLSIAFRATKSYRWLIGLLTHSKVGLYFGAISAALHASLLDDPIVCRRDVKGVLQVLLAWCECLPESGIRVDCPNHSQRIRLNAVNNSQTAGEN